MVQVLSSNANSYSAGKEIPCFYGTKRYINEFMKAYK